MTQLSSFPSFLPSFLPPYFLPSIHLFLLPSLHSFHPSEFQQGEMLAISNCMVIGDRRKFLAMVISLKTVMDTETGASTDNLAPDSLHVGKQV